MGIILQNSAGETYTVTEAENLEIAEMRKEELVGKTIQGTLITTLRKSGKKTYWVRWNKRKCDMVLIVPSLLQKHLGTVDPLEGTQIRCTIDALGPDFHTLKFKSAWCMHPQAKEIEVISHGYINPPNPLKRAQRAASQMSTLSKARSTQLSQTDRPRSFNSRVHACRGNSSLSWRNIPKCTPKCTATKDIGTSERISASRFG